MLCYGILGGTKIWWYAMRLKCYLYDIRFQCYGMMFQYYAMLCYGICCKIFAWTDCTMHAVF